MIEENEIPLTIGSKLYQVVWYDRAGIPFIESIEIDETIYWDASGGIIFLSKNQGYGIFSLEEKKLKLNPGIFLSREEAMKHLKRTLTQEDIYDIVRKLNEIGFDVIKRDHIK